MHIMVGGSMEIGIHDPGDLSVSRVEIPCADPHLCDCGGGVDYVVTIQDDCEHSVLTLHMPSDGWASLATAVMRVLAENDPDLLAEAIDRLDTDGVTFSQWVAEDPGGE